MVSKIQKMLEAICEDISDQNLPRLGDPGSITPERINSLQANRQGKPAVKPAASAEEPAAPAKAQGKSATKKAKQAPKSSGKRDAQWHVPAKLDTESLGTQGKVQKLAPQARVIYETVLNHGPLTREALCEKLKPVIQTRQPVERLVAFYRSALVKAGLVQISNIEG